MKKSLFLIIGLILPAMLLAACENAPDLPEIQTPQATDTLLLPSPSPKLAATPEPDISESPSPEPTNFPRKFLTEEEAIDICNSWLKARANLQLVIPSQLDYVLYPSHIFWGEQYYSFYVKGLSVLENGESVSNFNILVHIETGEALFMIKTNGERPATVVGLLEDFGSGEQAAPEPKLSAEEARAFYDLWLDGDSDTLSRESYEEFELFGEWYYLFRDENLSNYWYNILVHAETGELLLMLSGDGQFPVVSIQPLTDEWGWVWSSDWWDANEERVYATLENNR